MLTAKVEDDDIIHGLQLGAGDYVLKPFTPGLLKAKVSSLINGLSDVEADVHEVVQIAGNGYNCRERTGTGG